MSRQAQIDRTAVNRIEAEFIEAGGHELEITKQDYGRDSRIIFRDKGHARGFSTSLQIKGTETIDTEKHQAFRFPIDVKNIIYLGESPEPAYYLVHNCNSRCTYYREVHEIHTELDSCIPGWRSKKGKIGIIFPEENLLTNDRADWMLSEAQAWAYERQTLRGDVTYLEEQVKRFTVVSEEMRETDGGQYFSLAFSGLVRGARFHNILDVLVFARHLAYCYALCKTFRSRVKHSSYPWSITATSAIGNLNLAELTEKLQDARREYEQLHEKIKVLIGEKSEMAPTNRPITPRSIPGPVMIGLEIDDRSILSDKLRKRYEQMGITVQSSGPGDSDLELSCLGKRALLSLRIFNVPIYKRYIHAFRKRVERENIEVAAMLIHPSQSMNLGSTRWKRSPKIKLLPIPIGTTMPTLGCLDTLLLRTVLKEGPIADVSLSATEHRVGWSCSLPTWARTNPARGEYQRDIVRRHAQDALSILDDARFASFIFIDPEKELVEMHTFLNATQLLAYITAGFEAFESIGGFVNRNLRIG